MSAVADKPSTPHYLPHLDSLRGLAALGVVVAHFNPAPLVVSPSSGLGWLLDFWKALSLGNIAVVFFFTLSAFLLTYLARLEHARTGHFSVTRFIARRILRIWPLYFSVAAVAYFLSGGFIHLPPEFAVGAGTWQWLREHFWLYAGFFSNWSLAFNYIGTHVDPSPGALRILWSIGVEEQFYLVYPFILVLVLWRPRATIWLAGLVLLIAWVFRGWFATLEVTNASLGSAGGMYYASFSYLDVLLAGAIAGWLAAGPPLRPSFVWLARSWTGPLLVAAGTATGVVWTAHRWYPYDFVSVAIYPVMGGIFALFLFWICAGSVPPWLRFLTWHPLRKLGALSYGIYMWHVISYTCFSAALSAWAPDSYLFSSPWFRLLGSIFAAIAFATASRFLIEQPFLRLKARFTSGQSELPPGAAQPRLGPSIQILRWIPVNSRVWLVVLFAYVLLYGALLLKTDGYPYVFDNNESYSSLWHARSLYENGVSHTKGLTDEVFSTHPAASPYIHSHQGNFPRLFTFVLYALGLRTIEPQIWVTTFTIGLAALWFAFRFFSRLVNPVYAALTCLVLMTDYLFFMQWQVGLYNIWHGFFFFSSLVCIQTLGSTERYGRWFTLALLNFAALFYWEYVFTAFVAVLCGLYAIVLYWRRFRLVWLIAAAGAAGAALAAGALLAQLTAYMGWANVMEDVRLTLTARNAAADPVLLERVTSFYREHHIIFWHNFLDAAPLRTLAALWDSLLRFHLKFYSPTLLYAATVLAAGWWLGDRRWFGGLLGRKLPETVAGLSRRDTLLLLVAGVVKALLTAACLTGLIRPFYHSAVSPVLSLGAALLLGYLWTGLWWGWHRIGWLRFIPMVLLVAIAGWAGQWTADALDPSLQEEFLLTPGGPAILAVNNPLLLLITGLAFSYTAAGTTSMLGRLSGQRLAGLPAFLLCGIIAYGVTYRVFTGYIYSGYLHRFVPLPVFLTVPLLGLALYLNLQPLVRSARSGWQAMTALLAGVGRLFRAPLSREREQAAIDSTSALVRVLPLVIGLAIMGGLVGSWGLLQTTFARVAPADTYAFLTQLERPPFKGRSLVTNVYPAPMAARTGSWGYADTSFFSGILRLGPDGYQIERNLIYLWFADRDTNPDYLKPDLAITVIQTPNFNEARDRYQEWQSTPPDALPRVANTSLFKRAKQRFQPFMHHRIAATDGRRYSIVSLDWDFPPYLAPQDIQVRELAGRLTRQQKLTLSATAQDLARRWRVELDFLDFPLAPASAVELTGDGLPVIFSAADYRGSCAAIIHADRLNLRLLPSAQGGRVRVTVNDASEIFDLRTLTTAEAGFEWSAAQPLGKYTHVPRFAPGFYVQTTLFHQTGRPFAELAYHYVHQEAAPEASTTVRLYAEDAQGRWHLADTVRFLGPAGVPVRLAEFQRANPETVAEHARLATTGDGRTYEQWLADHLASHPDEWTRAGIVQEALPAPFANSGPARSSTVRRLPLPSEVNGRLQFSVSPGTRTKAGPEYFGLPFSVDAFRPGSATTVAFAAPPTSEDASTPPYGRLRLKLKFPTNRWPQAEPLLTTGSNEAGDIVYVIYHDARHIRLGFDHWFKGGPVTKPIPVDFTREHELEISLGSLFPPGEDIVFIDQPADKVATVKNRVLILLDGQTVIDSDGTCYDSSPSQVRIGRNDIHGTSSGPLFSGKILSIERIWPDIK